MDFEFVPGLTKEVGSLLAKWHYSKCYHIGSKGVGILRHNTQIVGICALAHTISSKWGQATGLSIPILELSRLVGSPEYHTPLTPLISFTLRESYKKSGVALYCSYADMTHGHHGGVYQAGSWNYSGVRAPKQDGYLIEGRMVSNRAASAKFGTASRVKLIEAGMTIEPHYDNGKLFYWRALTKAAAKAATDLGWSRVPYPKPSRTPWTPVMPFRRKADGPGRREINLHTGEIRKLCLDNDGHAYTTDGPDRSLARQPDRGRAEVPRDRRQPEGTRHG